MVLMASGNSLVVFRRRVQIPRVNYLPMLQSWLIVAHSSKFYTVSTVLFHKYGGSNVSVTNCMSHFSKLSPIKATVKLANIKTGHDQGIGIILCRYSECPIIYPVGPVFNYTFQPSNFFHWVPSNVVLVSKRLYLNLLNIVIFLPSGSFLKQGSPPRFEWFSILG